MIQRNIPNAITCANLLCGCLAIVKIFEGDLLWAASLVGIGALLDFFDGLVARLLRVTSVIGKDLDSLADVVSFGVVPGFMMYRMIGMFSQQNSVNSSAASEPLAYLAFLLPLFSAIRLARFNSDTRQSDLFIGLPTPANALFICSIPVILYMAGDSSVRPEGWLTVQLNNASILSGELTAPVTLLRSVSLLCSLCVINSLLLLAPIPLFALKFKHFKWKGNEIRYLFLLWSVLLLAFLQVAGLPLAIFSYVLFSLVNNLSKKSSP